MRIDFESLQLQNPVRTSTGAVNKAGNCVVDTLKFSTTSGDKLETLCGTETDMSQHIYMGSFKNLHICILLHTILSKILDMTLVIALQSILIQMLEHQPQHQAGH